MWGGSEEGESERGEVTYSGVRKKGDTETDNPDASLLSFSTFFPVSSCLFSPVCVLHFLRLSHCPLCLSVLPVTLSMADYDFRFKPAASEVSVDSRQCI